MSKFGKLLGKLTITIAGEELDLSKTKVEDKQKLMDLSKLKEKEYLEGVKVVTEILRKNYPEEPIEEIQKFCDRNYLDIMEEMSIAFGWTTRKKLEKAKEEALEKEKEKKKQETNKA